MLTQDQLKDRFHYDPETGIFTNRIKNGSRGVPGATAGWIDNKDEGRRKYTRIKINTKHHLATKLAWLYVYGEYPRAVQVLDGDGTNIRLSNLKKLDYSKKPITIKPSKNNTSGHVGVRRKHGKWCANIGYRGEDIYLGIFETKEAAIKARRDAEIEFGYRPS